MKAMVPYLALTGILGAAHGFMALLISSTLSMGFDWAIVPLFAGPPLVCGGVTALWLAMKDDAP